MKSVYNWILKHESRQVCFCLSSLSVKINVNEDTNTHLCILKLYQYLELDRALKYINEYLCMYFKALSIFRIR